MSNQVSPEQQPTVAQQIKKGIIITLAVIISIAILGLLLFIYIMRDFAPF